MKNQIENKIVSIQFCCKNLKNFERWELTIFFQNSLITLYCI